MFFVFFVFLFKQLASIVLLFLLSNFSLYLDENDLFGLVGRSPATKPSLVRCCCGCCCWCCCCCWLLSAVAVAVTALPPCPRPPLFFFSPSTSPSPSSSSRPSSEMSCLAIKLLFLELFRGLENAVRRNKKKSESAVAEEETQKTYFPFFFSSLTAPSCTRGTPSLLSCMRRPPRRGRRGTACRPP